jgi:phosphoglycerate kinase
MLVSLICFALIFVAAQALRLAPQRFLTQNSLNKGQLFPRRTMELKAAAIPAAAVSKSVLANRNVQLVVKAVLVAVLIQPLTILLKFIKNLLFSGIFVKKGSGRWPPMVTTPPVDTRKMNVLDLKAGDLKGKTVLVRCDLNVPLKGGRITDDTRVRGSMPTIKYLVQNGAKVMLISHLGRPKDGYDDAFSLAPVAPRLSELLGKEVKLCPDCIGPSVKKMHGQMNNGDVILLQNSRFYKEEEKNVKSFARELSRHADIFVNDAFGTAHRAHASTEGVTAFLKPSVAGFLLKKELDYLQGAVDVPKRPFAAIVGGSKVSSKISVIEAMLGKVDKLILGGGMVFTFLKARGVSVGSSLVEDDQLELAKRLEAMAKEKGVEIFLADDVVVADKFSEDANIKVVDVNEIPDGWMGLDIGPKTLANINAGLDSCQTVIWNGPMGVFEMEAFSKGTVGVAEKLASMTGKGCVTIIGGGDSVAAVEKAGLAEKMSHISTGGGASLELLEGLVLPGVAALDEI